MVNINMMLAMSPGTMHKMKPMVVITPTIKPAMTTLPMFLGLKNDPIVTWYPLAMSSIPPIYPDWIAAPTMSESSHPMNITRPPPTPVTLYENEKPFSSDV